MPNISSIYRPRNLRDSGIPPIIGVSKTILRDLNRSMKSASYVRKVIYRCLDCDILHNGFARVKCGDCGHEYLLAFSCKRRHFCPSCHQKRVIEFGEWLCQEVIKAVPHRHFIFSIPKILRRYFLYDRKLLSELSRRAWETLKVSFQETVPEEDARENLARYIIRASFSQERMTYIREESKVIYKSKDGRQQKAFDALEGLAAMSSHIPNKGEQMVRYCGYYCNVCRGRRQKENQDGVIPYIIEQEANSQEYRRNWARLIQKIYEVDPLACPRCQGKMSIISFIENEEVIRRILEHLGLWLVKRRPQPRANAPPVQIHLDYSRRGVGPSGPEADSQIPSFENDVHKDPDYPIETYAP